MTEIENGSSGSNNRLHAMYIVLIALLIGGLVYTNVKLKKSKETRNLYRKLKAIELKMQV